MNEVYTAICGGYDREWAVPVERRLILDTPETAQYLEGHGSIGGSRLAAKFWKTHPHVACPDAEVTVWLDGNMVPNRPSFLDDLVRELGDDDLLLFRHPWRDDIYEEAAVSRTGQKYDGQPLEAQVAAYREQGHPEHWGLMHAAVIVRRNTPAMRALDDALWAETLRWTLQDQIALAYLLRGWGGRWHWHPDSIFEHVTRRDHVGPDVWRAA